MKREVGIKKQKVRFGKSKSYFRILIINRIVFLKMELLSLSISLSVPLGLSPL